MKRPRGRPKGSKNKHPKVLLLETCLIQEWESVGRKRGPGLRAWHLAETNTFHPLLHNHAFSNIAHRYGPLDWSGIESALEGAVEFCSLLRCVCERKKNNLHTWAPPFVFSKLCKKEKNYLTLCAGVFTASTRMINTAACCQRSEIQAS